MAFRLDYAFWAASLVTTVLMRIGIIASSNRSYLVTKYSTWAIDYFYIGATLYFLEQYLTYNFTPDVVYKHQVLNSALVCVVDILKAFLFSRLLPATKVDHLKMLRRDLGSALFTLAGWKETFAFLGRLARGEGIVSEFEEGKTIRKSVRHQIWYWLKIGGFAIPSVVAIQTQYGLFTCEPLNEIVTVVGEREWYECHVSRFFYVYMEFLVIMLVKDAVSMNVGHQLLHSVFYSHHKTHHLPMKELSIVNAFYFDILDLFLADGIGPLLIILIKGLFGAPMQVHYAAYMLCVLCDQTCHSLNPYTCSFWNPFLDDIMRPTVSHNLHHALSKGHYTIWPIHHIYGVTSANMANPKRLGGFDEDMKEYNKIYGTSFPTNL